MDQPLDLSLSNTKTPFTIEYLTSNQTFSKRRTLPLNSLENQIRPLISSSIEIVNGGHGIKNPLFDCATEALQIQYSEKQFVPLIIIIKTFSFSFS